MPIQVVGFGPRRATRCARRFRRPSFLGRVADEELARLYAGARAVVVPGIEEFGITAVEAQAAGRPVIAAAAGGALETVLDGETGLLATPDDAGSFAAAIRGIEHLPFQAARAVEHAAGFSVERFRERITAFVRHALERSGS